MSIFWLRVAAALYSLGLVDAVIAALGRRSPLFGPALASFSIGAVLHMVSIVELALHFGHLPVDNFYETVSLCAFLIALVFLYVYWRYQFAGIRVVLFPLVALMTLTGATEIPVASWANPRVRDIWLLVHVALILLGYAALLVTAAGSVFYLIEERRLKLKRPRGLLERMPALGTLDELITRSMGVGFVFITAGLVAASTWAFIESGTRWIGEAKIAIAFLTWAVYLAMVFLRAVAGWRGRKAALLAIGALACSAVTWAAHVGLRTLLTQ